jgi:hypothetical protein
MPFGKHYAEFTVVAGKPAALPPPYHLVGLSALHRYNPCQSRRKPHFQAATVALQVRYIHLKV